MFCKKSEWDALRSRSFTVFMRKKCRPNRRPVLERGRPPQGRAFLFPIWGVINVVGRKWVSLHQIHSRQRCANHVRVVFQAFTRQIPIWPGPAGFFLWPPATLAWCILKPTLRRTPRRLELLGFIPPKKRAITECFEPFR